jgi:cleavage and polyadenylation specificity factor subunit 3
MTKFLPLGGANEIGANSYYLNIDGTGIILDCGMHPQKTGIDALPDFNLLRDKPLDYVLISHAHQDHLNALPFLIKKFPYLKIITTPQTRAIAELTLINAITILSRQIKDESFKIYSREEVDLLIQSIVYKVYNEKFDIRGIKPLSDKKITAEFFDAGHVLGSAGILIEYDDHKLFFTGDINLSSQTLMNGASLPSTKINTLILECTYGATDSNLINNWEDETSRLVTTINKTFNNGGSVLIPVFSFGKMQEMLATIHLLMEKRKLVQADIYTGGIGTKINRIYDYNRYVVERNEEELILHDIPTINYYDIKSMKDFFKYPSIVLASSGMMIESTMSYILARRWLKQKNSAIFTVGYMDDRTPGYLIANSKKGDKLGLHDIDEEVTVECTIKNFRFSAHSKREELLEIIEKLNPEFVVLIHGGSEAINWMGSKIFKLKKDIKVHSAVNGKEISFAS